MIIGFTNAEGEFFRWRIKYYGVISQVNANSALLLNNRLLFSTSANVSRTLGRQVADKYLTGPTNLDDLVKIFGYNFFKYPAFKLVQWRLETGSASTYLYHFTYESDLNIVKSVLMLEDYCGATHLEDLLYVFRDNQYLGHYGRLPARDDFMRHWMTTFFYNFMICRWERLDFFK